jgi:hypothetical protein
MPFGPWQLWCHVLMVVRRLTIPFRYKPIRQRTLGGGSTHDHRLGWIVREYRSLPGQRLCLHCDFLKALHSLGMPQIVHSQDIIAG